MEPESGGEKGNAHSNFVCLRTRTPALEEMDNSPLRAVVAAHAAAAVAPTPEGATPAVAASAPLIGATAVAPGPLGSVPVLRTLTPVVRVVVEMLWKAGMGLAGPGAFDNSSLVSLKGPVDEGSAYCRSSLGDPVHVGIWMGKLR